MSVSPVLFLLFFYLLYSLFFLLLSFFLPSASVATSRCWRKLGGGGAPRRGGRGPLETTVKAGGAAAHRCHQASSRWRSCKPLGATAPHISWMI